MKPLGPALFVFAFMALLTAHAYGRVLHAVLAPGSTAAIRGIDAVILGGFVGGLGHMPAVVALALLTLLFSYLAFRRAAAEQHAVQQAAPRSAAPISPAAAASMPPPHAPAFPPAPTPAESKSLREAAEQCLGFRHVFPPRLPMTSMTFFGGVPIAPPDFVWPRLTDKEGNSEPLDFMGQVDCSTIPAGGNRELLPARGVLYFFAGISTSRNDAGGARYVHYVDGPINTF